MSIRLRITFVFALLVFIVIAAVCTAVYFFSYQSREWVMKNRLTNRAITTGKLFSQKETFDSLEIYRIDASTAISIKNKEVQIYDSANRKIYDYSDLIGGEFPVDEKTLNKARSGDIVYLTNGRKEGIAYYYKNPNNEGFVVVSSGEDIDGKDHLKRLANILIVSFIVAVILVLFIGYTFSKKLLGPIKNITREITEISVQNLKRRIDVGKTKDEWYYLSQTLNKLLDRVHENIEMQKRFISNASHELCTPLTSISSQLEVIMDKERDPVFHQKLIHSVYQDVQNMSKLTRTLLQLAKASENFGGLEISAIRIDEVLFRLPEEIAKTNPDYLVELSFDNLPEEESTLWTLSNELLLVTAIRNVVINACKYSKDKKAIVTLRSDDAHHLISVQDNGIGISKANLKKIFQPFFRVEENQNTEGFGLGLTLAMRIIKLHKGSIEVSSEPGQGTIFTVTLPRLVMKNNVFAM